MIININTVYTRGAYDVKLSFTLQNEEMTTMARVILAHTALGSDTCYADAEKEGNKECVAFYMVPGDGCCVIEWGCPSNRLLDFGIYNQLEKAALDLLLPRVKALEEHVENAKLAKCLAELLPPK